MRSKNQRGASISQNFKSLFDRQLMKDARYVVKKLQRRIKSLKEENFEDLFQECLLHWIFAGNKYDSSKGFSIRTFLDRVITRKLYDIACERSAAKRKALLNSLSLEALLEQEDMSYFKKFLADERSADSILKEDLSEALRKTMGMLSQQQREVCDLLGEQGLSIRQASQRLNIANTTLQHEIKRIREVFRKEGLEDYLK